MTDWERVAELRRKGKSWPEIAGDRRVGFHPESDTDPGRALKVLFLQRRSRGSGSRKSPSSERSQPGLRARFPTRRSLTPLVGVAVLGVVIAVVVLLLLTSVHPGTPSIITYCGGEGASAHYHVLLVIDHDGVQQHLPYDSSQGADIGYINQPGFTNPAYYCPASGFHAIHTHDGSGILHLEIPSGIPLDPSPTLGEFFQIWGEPLTTSQVWSFTGRVTAEVVLPSGGHVVDYSSNPSGIPLPVPPGGPFSNPYPIPPNLIFQGAYGTGQSGGTFDGEILWLNVTSSGVAGGPIRAAMTLGSAPPVSRSAPGAPGDHWRLIAYGLPLALQRAAFSDQAPVRDDLLRRRAMSAPARTAAVATIPRVIQNA